MSVGFRPMRDGQEDAVAAMVRQLPQGSGLPVAPKLTGDGLRKARGLVHVTVAEDLGLLLGACLWLLTFSTWRGCKGMYVVDLFVMEHARGKKVGERLLESAMKQAAAVGAEFVKLEVDESNTGGARFYDRLGFGRHPEDELFIMKRNAQGICRQEIVMTIKTVGLIGAGLMGHGIGRNVVEKGFALVTMAHRNREPVEDLVKRGAKELGSPAEIAKASDMVIICVTATPQVEEAVYGANGILAAGKSGLIVADCSTAIPELTVKISAHCATKGVTFIDTPMTRTPREAEAGKLGLMVGGDPGVLEKIRPVLSTFADMIIHTGAVGTAHQVKLIKNFLFSLGHAAIAAEAISVATKAGVDMTALRDIIMGGGGASVMFSRLINVPLSDDDSHAKFAIRNARKDLRYYTNMTENMPLPLLPSRRPYTRPMCWPILWATASAMCLIDMMVKNSGGK